MPFTLDTAPINLLRKSVVTRIYLKVTLSTMFCCSASFAALLTTFSALCAKYSVKFSPRLTIILMLFGFSALLQEF